MENKSKRLLTLPFILSVAILSISYGILLIILNIFKYGRKYFNSPKLYKIERVATEASLGTQKTAHLKDIDINYVECGDPGKPLLLFSHGFPEFWFSWRHQIREFQRDFRVVAFDTRGQGYSSKPQDVKSYGMKHFVEDIRQLMQHLGVQRCTLVGHDMGGVIFWHFASKYPQMVERLVQINAPHPLAFLRVYRSSWRQMMKSWYIFFFQLPYLPEWYLSRMDYKYLKDAMTTGAMGLKKRTLSQEEKDTYESMYRNRGYLTSSVNFYRASFRYGEQPPTQKIQTPTLLIWGTEDGALTLPIARGIQDLCDDMRVEYLDGVSHFAQQDAPESVNQLMWRFFEETSD